MEKDALNEIQRKHIEAQRRGSKFTDPNALLGGFTRGTGRREQEGTVGGVAPEDWKEHEQEMFLRRQGQGDLLDDKNEGTIQGPPEMPEDLIKFLTDTGPIQRKIDKSQTSPRLYDSLVNEEEERKAREVESKKRPRRREMPMMEGVDDVTTSRTTNFSMQTIEEEGDDPTALHLTDEELYNMLVARKSGHCDPDDGSTDIASAASLYLDRHFSSVVDITEEQRKSNVTMLQNVLRYNGIPVLMKDTDGSYVGAWDHKVSDLKMMKLKPVPRDKFVYCYEAVGEDNATATGDEVSSAEKNSATVAHTASKEESNISGVSRPSGEMRSSNTLRT